MDVNYSNHSSSAAITPYVVITSITSSVAITSIKQNSNEKNDVYGSHRVGDDGMYYDRNEIVLASYGYYDEGGRYTYLRAYSPNGKYLKHVGEKEPE